MLGKRKDPHNKSSKDIAKEIAKKTEWSYETVRYHV